MFHIDRLRNDPKKDVDYSHLYHQYTSETEQLLKKNNETEGGIDSKESKDDNDDNLPEAPDGFEFYRIKRGDNLVTLSLRLNSSQTTLKQYNPELCFGNKLGHMVKKLILVPRSSTPMYNEKIGKYVKELNDPNNKDVNTPENDEEDYKNLTEGAKHTLRKALQMFSHNDIEIYRCDYYLGMCNWNIREAYKLYKKDRDWEKQNKLSKLLNIKMSDAKDLLMLNEWNIDKAIKHHKKNPIVLNNTDNEGKNDKQDETLLQNTVQMHQINTDGIYNYEDNGLKNRKQKKRDMFCCGNDDTINN